MMTNSKKQLVIAGSGMAAGRLIEDMVRRGGLDRWEVSLVGEEPSGGYNRILLSGVLSGEYRPRDVVMQPPTWFVDNGVRLFWGERVLRVDREARCIETSGRLRLPYDALVMATGSRPWTPPVPGIEGEKGVRRQGVFVFRTLQDCRAIRAWAARSRRAVVVGGGLLGLEAARGLQLLGLEVTVVEAAPHLMAQQLDAAGGEALGSVMERMGVRLRPGRVTRRLTGESAVDGVELDDGELIPADMVVVSCGVRPNVELARECGLDVGRAILVDDSLTTSDPYIHALGECAEHGGTLYGLVAPLYEQAAVLADRLSGCTPGATYGGSRVATRLKVMGVELATMGDREASAPGDEVVCYSEPARGIYKKLIIREGRLAGAMVLGDSDRAASLLQAWDRQSPLATERSALLFSLGSPGMQSVEDLPSQATVCHCNGVSKGDIERCVLLHGAALHEVQQVTRAGTGCGSCKTLVRTLIDRCVTSGAAPAVPQAAGAVR